MIISVGYRVNAKRGVQFRRWTNKILKQYLMKGYVVNDRLRRDQLGELHQSSTVPMAPSVWRITPSWPSR